MTSALFEKAKLVGTWKLVSASSTNSKGKRDETVYGVNPRGFLSYSDDGRVIVLISYDGRKPLSVGASAEEEAEAFKTFLAYAGSYTCARDKITHHIEISSIQNFVNRDLTRCLKFKGNRIILTTPPTPVNGKIQTVELIWERLPAS